MSDGEKNTQRRRQILVPNEWLKREQCEPVQFKIRGVCMYKAALRGAHCMQGLAATALATANWPFTHWLMIILQLHFLLGWMQELKHKVLVHLSWNAKYFTFGVFFCGIASTMYFKNIAHQFVDGLSIGSCIVNWLEHVCLNDAEHFGQILL